MLSVWSKQNTSLVILMNKFIQNSSELMPNHVLLYKYPFNYFKSRISDAKLHKKNSSTDCFCTDTGNYVIPEIHFPAKMYWFQQIGFHTTKCLVSINIAEGHLFWVGGSV